MTMRHQFLLKRSEAPLEKVEVAVSDVDTHPTGSIDLSNDIGLDELMDQAPRCRLRHAEECANISGGNERMYEQVRDEIVHANALRVRSDACDRLLAIAVHRKEQFTRTKRLHLESGEKEQDPRLDRSSHARRVERIEDLRVTASHHAFYQDIKSY